MVPGIVVNVKQLTSFRSCLHIASQRSPSALMNFELSITWGQRSLIYAGTSSLVRVCNIIGSPARVAKITKCAGGLHFCAFVSLNYIWKWEDMKLLMKWGYIKGGIRLWGIHVGR